MVLVRVFSGVYILLEFLCMFGMGTDGYNRITIAQTNGILSESNVSQRHLLGG